MGNHTRHGGGGAGVRQGGRGQDRGPRSNIPVYFDPSKSEAELFDELAEKQCEEICQRIDAKNRLVKNQVRRFFGEIKELYRRNEYLSMSCHDPKEREERYKQHIEPMFRMIRSKAAYAIRAGGQSTLHKDFAHVLSTGIARVQTESHFRRFVMHLEAVVGFLYGSGKLE